MKSIFNKIYSAYFLLILIMSLLTYFVTIEVVYNSRLEGIKKDLMNQCQLIHTLNRIDIHDKNLTQLDSNLKTVAKHLNIRISIIEDNGSVLYDSERPSHLMDNHALRQEIVMARQEIVGSTIRYSSTLKSDLIYVAMKFNSDSFVYYLRVSMRLKEIDDLYTSIRNNFLYSFSFILFFSLIITFFVSRSFSRPIEQLAKFSNHFMKNENLDYLLAIRKDEIGQLSKSMAHMAKDLKTLIKDLQNEKEGLKTIINNMNEGLLVINSNGEILLSNKAMEKVFASEKIDGNYKQYINESEFIYHVKMLYYNESNKQMDCHLNQRFYRISFAVISENKNIICIFYDLTEGKQLEKTKRDFVSNVSHELRTPLTSIKGFVETLKFEEQDENKLRYLDIIDKNSDRLIFLVKDLLLLSELEDVQFKLMYSKVHIKELISNAEILFITKLQNKNMQLILQFSDDQDPVIEADSFKLEQVFINLIDNAIKYSEKGTIKIAVSSENNQIVIQIADEGLGIPESEIDRIFERFYVVNKARSRSQGGTGLGLSLVKHIITLHHGKITVSSQLNVGTTFTIHLPKNKMN